MVCNCISTWRDLPYCGQRQLSLVNIVGQEEVDNFKGMRGVPAKNTGWTKGPMKLD